MNYFNELARIGKSLRTFAITFVLLVCFFFFFGMRNIPVFGLSLPVPVVSLNSFASETFLFLSESLIPPSVELVVTDPIMPFAVEAQVAVSLALIVLFPFMLVGILRYLFPALYAFERRIALLFSISAGVLFLLGGAFAFLFVIPKTFAVLYSFAPELGATSFFSASSFVSIALGLIVASGVAFLLPVAMVALVFFHVVSGALWWRLWREAFFGILVFCAIITPDGSGVGMLALMLPLVGLYCLGALVSAEIERQRARVLTTVTTL